MATYAGGLASTVDASTTTRARVAGVLRDVARGGLAGLIAGTLVGGVGGRLAMSAAAIVNPQAAGRFTANGELIGRFTVEGTLALLVFGGLGAGMVAGVLWVVLSPWVPWAGPRRWLAGGLLALVLGGPFLLESTNRDFVILEQILLIVVLLAVLVVLIGASVAWLDERLDRRMPPASGRLDGALLVSVIVAVAGLLPLAFTVLAFLSSSFSDAPRPPGVGLALLVAGGATVVLWILRIRGGRSRVPQPLRLAGAGGLVVAAGLGALHLGREVAAILAL